MRFGKIGQALTAAAALVGAALVGACPALAEPADLTWAPWSLALGEAQLRLAGDAQGAVFGPHQPGVQSGWSGTQISGALSLMPELRRDYDSGLSLGLVGTFTAADPLSRGRYDGDVIERLAGEARTGLGSFSMGLSDGAGYALAVTGPVVDAGVALNDPRTSFFRDPTTHRAVTDMFALRTQVGASSNYAKFVYTSPALLGVQLGLSFTPSEGKQFPFLNAGPHLAGRQADFWEAALRYSTDIETGLGPVTLSAYGALAEGRAEHKLPGQEGVSDLGAGVRADYALSDAITLAAGASWRQSNAYAFDVNRAFQGAVTRAQHYSLLLSDDKWRAGLEWGNGVAGAAAGLPHLGLNGMQASIGYQISASIGVSGGWQHLSYARGSGTFFNGAPLLKMDALYLHLGLQTSQE